MLEKVLIPQIYLPIIYICVALIINSILKRVVSSVLNKKQSKLPKNSYNYKKLETFEILIHNIIKYIIILFLALAIATVYGVDVTSVLAGLGIAGVILGLALQDFAKDIIAGISILLENQYAIGDIVSIGNFKGEIIFLGLRITKIKNEEGQVKIISNRNITELINYSISNSLAVIDISISTEQDIEKVENVLNNLAEQLSETLPSLKGKVEILGIEKLDASSIVYRLTAPTTTMEHIAVQRIMRKEIKKHLDKNNIKMR
ncbi:MAG: mechanosensitive ion channel [Firmicutes bacterium]|nr:mechanosensitive ion channel [Bacillota bacterium]